MERYQFKKLWHNLANSNLEQIEWEVNGNKENVVVEVAYSLVSQGTERLVTTQKLAATTYEKMKVPYLDGEFGKEFTYGYSMVGKVVDGPTELMGKYVHLMHPHQEMAFVSKEDVYVIPEMDNLKVAVLASNMETAINGIWDSGLSLGDKILIIGYGMIGALIAAIVKQFPVVDLWICEKDDFRYKLCKKHGFNAVKDTDKLPDSFDVVFNTSGSQAGLQLGIDKAALEANIVELSWYGPDHVHLNLGDKFHYNRVKITSSQVSHIPSCKSGNWDFEWRKKLVFDILQSVDLSYLITREVPFHESPKLYDDLRTGKIRDIGVALKY